MIIPFTSAGTRKAIGYFVGSALFAVVGAAAQVGIVGDTGIDSSGNYQQERAWCMANTSGEEQVACLKNSAAAQAEKRRGTLDKGANLDANAMLRCDALAGPDRAACQARVQGHGSASGSVQGGGILKQIETVVPPAGQR
ncbi:hypothetical protein [Rhodoferax sp. UBA5149]|uniref:hypothetical protein n=1 Tax=Rhodoferax sp. UBA5149 TaxID=1947379 RepID=UPI0025E9AF71|nr:hypothetical protein [Rhodoferax sp. UBA5149]